MELGIGPNAQNTVGDIEAGDLRACEEGEGKPYECSPESLQGLYIYEVHTSEREKERILRDG